MWRFSLPANIPSGCGRWCCATPARPPTRPRPGRQRLKMIDQVLAVGPAPVADAMVPRCFTTETIGRIPGAVEFVRERILLTPPEGIAAALRGLAERPDVTELLPTISRADAGRGRLGRRDHSRQRDAGDGRGHSAQPSLSCCPASAICRRSRRRWNSTRCWPGFWRSESQAGPSHLKLARADSPAAQRQRIDCFGGSERPENCALGDKNSPRLYGISNSDWVLTIA